MKIFNRRTVRFLFHNIVQLTMFTLLYFLSKSFEALWSLMTKNGPWRNPILPGLVAKMAVS